MKVWRRMEKISWTEHISNEVLKLVKEERSLLTIIRTRQRNWMGHIMTEAISSCDTPYKSYD